MASQNVNNIPIAVDGRSDYNLSFNHHLTMDFGRLQVLCCQEICPNDDVRLNIEGFLRGAPMPLPTFGNVRMDVRVFFVPNRILTPPSAFTPSDFCWDDWIDGNSSVAHPYINRGQLVDYFSRFAAGGSIGPDYYRDALRHVGAFGLHSRNGLFTDMHTDIRINPFPFAAFQRIWWDWYRDSSLIDETLISQYVPRLAAPFVSADVLEKIMIPRYACFDKDYFTTAKLNPQSGSATVGSRGLGSSATLNYTSQGKLITPSSDSIDFSFENGLSLPIQWLRAASALQMYLERNNLSGSRLRERFLARFGVAPQESVLSMSEYLGGDRQYVRIGDVTANSDLNNGSTPSFEDAFGPTEGNIMGQTAGKSNAQLQSGRIQFHAKEFGYLFAIGTLIPEVSYVDGVPRWLSRGTDNNKFAYLTPEMVNLGFEPISKSELSVAASPVENFGFTKRYQSYKTAHDVASGDIVLQGTSLGLRSLFFSRQLPAAGTDIVLSDKFTMITPDVRQKLDYVFSVIGDVGQYDHFQGIVHNEVHISRDLSNNDMPSLEPDNSGKKVSISNGGVRM